MVEQGDQTGSGGDDYVSPIDDPLFSDIDSGSSIFANKKLLSIGYIPDENRIVGREEQMEDLAAEVGPTVQGDPPNNVLIYGKTGSGKSLVSQYVSQRTKRAAESRGINFGYAYVDCSTDTSETQAIITIADELNDEDQTGISIPFKGLGTSNYYRRLWEILDFRYDVIVVILDEIDRLDTDDLLMTLSRAEESGKTDCHIGIIAISNKVQFRKTLNERVKSSLSEVEFVFDPYDAGQLKEILWNREDAFVDGVLEEATIPRCAALAAKEHGDARKAMDILRNAGEIAKRRGDDFVSEEHVDAAKEKAEIDRLAEVIESAPLQAKASLLALASLTDTGTKDGFGTSEVHHRYTEICDEINLEPVSHNRLYELLDEMEFLGITKIERGTSRGKNQGITNVHELRKDKEVVRKAVLSGSRFGGLKESEGT